jgi:endonuclease/exonuclease/phosphatase family metal-dependent hydrolase
VEGNELTALARLVVVLVIAGLVVVLGINAIGPERFWLFALIQYLPYPAFLLPALVAAGASMMLGWGWRIAAALCLILILTVVMGLRVNRGERGRGRIRVMTYNIKDYVTRERPGGLVAVAREISSADPDIVVLQDARREADISETDPTFLRPLVGSRQTFSFGQFVVASRLPLSDCARRDVPFRDEEHTYVRCVVTADDTEFELVTAHFITPRIGLSAARSRSLRSLWEWRQNVSDRMTQARSLARDLQLATLPVVVAGDLNAPETSLAVRALLDTGLRDAFSVAGLGYGYTWGHSLRLRFSFVRIDHILVGPEFRVADCFVGGRAGSDHRPVIADIYLTR